jgi:NTE family protein
MLVNAIFLDTLHHDVEILERTNYLIRHVPPESRVGLREIGCLCIEPSVDLGKLASQYELRARGAVRLFTRGLGTGETKSPDWLSMLLFNPDYLGAVIEIGWKDARRNRDNIESFLEETS